jgi:hypothetical protein
MLRNVVPFLFVLLLACAPTQRAQESWAQEIFGPSVETLNYACGLGFEEPSALSIKTYYGQLRVKLTSGQTIRFNSAPGQLYVLCRLYGLLTGPRGRDSFFASDSFQKFRQDARVFVFVEGDGLKKDQVRLEISLASKSGQELAQLKPDSTDTVESGIRYAFSPVISEQKMVLNDVSSFTLTLTIAGTSEKIFVDSSNYSALLKSEEQ